MPSFAMADKLVHFVCFGVLAFAVSFAIDIKRYVMVYAPVLIVSAYGVIDEIHQSMVPGRECSVGDWVADTIGAVAGVAMYVVVSEWMVEWKERRSEGGSASGRLSRA